MVKIQITLYPFEESFLEVISQSLHLLSFALRRKKGNIHRKQVVMESVGTLSRGRLPPFPSQPGQCRSRLVSSSKQGLCTLNHSP